MKIVGFQKNFWTFKSVCTRKVLLRDKIVGGNNLKTDYLLKKITKQNNFAFYKYKVKNPPS